MSTIEKHGALWVDGLQSQPEYERFDPEADLLAIVVRSSAGHFIASIYQKTSGAPQWRLPFWNEIRPEALFADKADAIAHAEMLLKAHSKS